MLVLTRKEGERIVIGDNIVVMVVGTKNGRYRIGIEAPPDVPIDREEVREAKEKNGTLHARHDAATALLRRLLDPEDLGGAVTAHVRDAAREALWEKLCDS